VSAYYYASLFHITTQITSTASYYTSTYILILIALAIICVLILLALQLVSMKALFLRLHKAVLRRYYCSTKALLRLYDGSTKAHGLRTRAGASLGVALQSRDCGSSM
jgi:hypothetical protein